MANHIRQLIKPGSIKRHIALVMAQSGFEAGAMTIASLLVARWLGPGLLGMLGMMLAGVQLVISMTDGFPLSIIRFVSNKPDSDPAENQLLGWRLAWYTIGLASGLAIIVGIVGWALTGFSADFTLIVISILLAITRASRSAFDSLFRALRSFRAPTLSGIFCTMAMSVAIIGFTWYGGGVATYLLLMTLFTALNTYALVHTYVKTFQTHGGKPGIDSETRNAFLQYSYPLLLRGLFAFLFLKVNIWIIGALASANDAGQFRLTDQFLTIPALVFSAVVTAIAPRIAEAQHRGKEHLSQLCARTYGLMLIMAFPMSLCFFFNGSILPYLFPGYEFASTMLVMFAPAVLFRGMANTSSLLLVQGGRPKAAFWLSFLPSIANICFAFAGYYLGGVTGLVAATAIVHLLTYILSLIVVHSLLQLPFRIRFR